jgi:hypothetical protein
VSDAIKCDRCGKYEPQMVNGVNPWGRKWIYISSNEDNSKYALCSRCAKAFNGFISGGKSQ